MGIWKFLWHKEWLYNLPSFIWWFIWEFTKDTIMDATRDFFARRDAGVAIIKYLLTHPGIIALSIFIIIAMVVYLKYHKESPRLTRTKEKQLEPLELLGSFPKDNIAITTEDVKKIFLKFNKPIDKRTEPYIQNYYIRRPSRCQWNICGWVQYDENDTKLIWHVHEHELLDKERYGATDIDYPTFEIRVGLSGEHRIMATDGSKLPETIIRVKIKPELPPTQNFYINYGESLAKRGKQVSNENERPIHVESHNQQGGITAYQVNIQPGDRQLSTGAVQQVKDYLNTTKFKTIEVNAVMGDGEAFRFASQMKNYLTQEGFEVSGVNQVIYSAPVQGQIIEPPNDEGMIKIIVGNR